MSDEPVEWPKKTRELHNHHFDSTTWNDFPFRDDDIIISTYAKSGTTWVQQIVSQLLFNGTEDLPVAEMSPWMDLRVPPKEVKLPMVEAFHSLHPVGGSPDERFLDSMHPDAEGHRQLAWDLAGAINALR